MKKCSYFCTALAVLIVFCTAAGQEPVPTQPTSLPVGSATITQIKGEVVLHGPQGEALVAQRGLVLAAASTIETQKGNLLLELQDGSQVLVKPHSRVMLQDPNQGKGFYLELLIGKVVNKIQKRLGNTPSFRMGTPTAVVTVRGTRFEVEVNKKLRTYVVVYEGMVEVAGMFGAAPPVLVRPGFITNVDRDREPAQPREIGEGRERGGSESGRDREGFGRNDSEREGRQQRRSPTQEGPDD
ncbi:MAG: FecR family protein [Acidobacteriia bacterium]|nr:FecR family protein [Terriglobia bacterium]